MKSTALIGALVGGAIGAIIWGAITTATGYEVGFVAWGIGLLVGGGAKLLGGQGQSMAILCALLALVAIFAGKVLAVQMAAPAELRKIANDTLTRDDYEEAVQDAADFAELGSEEDYASYMVTHGYSSATSTDEIDWEEAEYFKEEEVPRLQEFHLSQPSFQRWREDRADLLVEIFMANVDMVEIVKENLGPLDFLFAFLGLATAYKLVATQEV